MTSDSLFPVQGKKKSNKTTCVSLYSKKNSFSYLSLILFHFVFALTHAQSCIFYGLSIPSYITTLCSVHHPCARLTAAGTTLT